MTCVSEKSGRCLIAVASASPKAVVMATKSCLASGFCKGPVKLMQWVK